MSAEINRLMNDLHQFRALTQRARSAQKARTDKLEERIEALERQVEQLLNKRGAKS